jgi:hypothetical protein
MTSHTTFNSVAALQNIFEDQIISHHLWPFISPDLTQCDFNLLAMEFFPNFSTPCF